MVMRNGFEVKIENWRGILVASGIPLDTLIPSKVRRKNFAESHEIQLNFIPRNSTKFWRNSKIPYEEFRQFRIPQIFFTEYYYPIRNLTVDCFLILPPRTWYFYGIKNFWKARSSYLCVLAENNVSI